MQPLSDQLFGTAPANSFVTPQAEPVAPVVTEPTSPTRVARVLQVINGEHYSGAERVQDLLSGCLPRYGFDVGLVCVKPGKFRAARQSIDAQLDCLPMRWRFDLAVVRELTAMIRDQQYEIVHAHTPRTALVGHLAARQAGVPFVYHVHSPTSQDSTRVVINWVNSLVERWSTREAARLIVVSPSLEQHMVKRGFPAPQVTCVPNGVPCVEGATPRQAPTGTWTLGTVALFRRRKGLEILLEALAMLRSRGVDVRLRAVGPFETPAYESAIMCLVERLGIADVIEWVGFTRDVNAELARMDLFALPSLFGEGLPMVVLEAMAVGVPVVATHVEGVPQAVEHRHSGLLVQPRNVSQLALAIEDVVDGTVDYESLSRRSLERQRERFSDEAMAEGVARVYREVLGAR